MRRCAAACRLQQAHARATFLRSSKCACVCGGGCSDSPSDTTRSLCHRSQRPGATRAPAQRHGRPFRTGPAPLLSAGPFRPSAFYRTADGVRTDTRRECSETPGQLSACHSKCRRPRPRRRAGRHGGPRLSGLLCSVPSWFARPGERTMRRRAPPLKQGLTDWGRRVTPPQIRSREWLAACDPRNSPGLRPSRRPIGRRAGTDGGTDGPGRTRTIARTRAGRCSPSGGAHPLGAPPSEVARAARKIYSVLTAVIPRL